MRDSQRLKLYRAENIVLPNDIRIETVPEIEEFVRKILNSSWTKRRFNGATEKPITILDGRRRKSACAWTNEISIPCKLRSKKTIFHELSHSIDVRITIGEHALSEYVPHGWKFASIYLEFVRHFMGYEDFKLLKESFRKNHVRFRPKRKGYSNPKAIEALKKYRESKTGIYVLST